MKKFEVIKIDDLNYSITTNGFIGLIHENNAGRFLILPKTQKLRGYAELDEMITSNIILDNDQIMILSNSYLLKDVQTYRNIPVVQI